MQQAQSPGDVEAPIAALRHIPRIAQREHELVAGLGVLAQRKAAARRALAPCEIWQGGGDDVEGDVGGVGAVLERGEHFGYFDVASGPAVDEQEGDGVGVWGGLVQVVDVERGEVGDSDGAVVVGELV